MVVNKQKVSLVMNDQLAIAGNSYQSRWLVVTGKYKALMKTRAAIDTSGAEIVTMTIPSHNNGQHADDAVCDSVLMASAMKKTVKAGRELYLTKRLAKKHYSLSPSFASSGVIY